MEHDKEWHGRTGFYLFASVLPVFAQDFFEEEQTSFIFPRDCTWWERKGKSYWEEITPEQVQTCIDNGEDINAIKKSGRTLLHWISNFNTNPEVIKALVNAGAYLLALDENQETPLDLAKKYNRSPEFISLLMDLEAKIRAPGGLCPFWNQQDEIYWQQITLEEVQTCLNNGTDVNLLDTQGFTPFHRVLQNGNLEIITAFLNGGADIKLKEKDGRTPLYLAIEFNGNAELITTLLDAGADIKAREGDGRTPLYLAIEFNGNAELITTLLDAGADINSTGRKRKNTASFCGGAKWKSRSDSYFAI